jgi:hypothetical protein
MFKKKVSSAPANANAPFNCAWWAEQSGKNDIPRQVVSAHLRKLESKGKLFKYADNPYAVVQFFPTAGTTTDEIISELAKI